MTRPTEDKPLYDALRMLVGGVRVLSGLDDGLKPGIALLDGEPWLIAMDGFDAEQKTFKSAVRIACLSTNLDFLSQDETPRVLWLNTDKFLESVHSIAH